MAICLFRTTVRIKISNQETSCTHEASYVQFNPLNAELNPICHLLALLGARHILHISRIRVN